MVLALMHYRYQGYLQVTIIDNDNITNFELLNVAIVAAAVLQCSNALSEMSNLCLSPPNYNLSLDCL